LFFLGGAAGAAMVGLAWAAGGWPMICVIGAGFGITALVVDCIGRPEKIGPANRSRTFWLVERCDHLIDHPVRWLELHRTVFRTFTFLTLPNRRLKLRYALGIRDLGCPSANGTSAA
jgi:hypothetical protein